MGGYRGMSGYWNEYGTYISWKKSSKKLKTSIKISVGQAGLELLIKILFNQ